MIRNLGLPLLPPLAALALQLLLWRWLNPYYYLFFYPAVFFSSAIGGLRGGLVATAFSTLVIACVFIQPHFAAAIDDPAAIGALAIFALMGVATARVHDQVKSRRDEIEAQFATTFETASTGLILAGCDARFLKVNARICDMLGYTPEELLTKTVAEVTHPDDLGLCMEMIRATLEQDQRRAPVEKRYRRKDGSVFWANVAISLWANVAISLARDARGQPAFLLASIEDIDARKGAEQELRASNAMFEAALANMSDAVCITDADGDFVRINASFASFYRFGSPLECARSLAELTEKITRRTSDGALVPIEDWPIARALRGETAVAVEYLLERNATGERWVGSSNFAPIRDAAGAVTGAVVTTRDITQKKAVETALTESGRRLSLFFEHAPAALALFDREMRYLAVSRKWRRDHSAMGELIGRSHYELFPDQTPERWVEAHRRGLAGEIVRNDEDYFLRPDGTLIWIRWELYPWRQADGSVGGIAIFSEDITALHDASVRLRELNADLERRVVERTEELSDARERAEEASKAKSAFLANMSHEIRTPLNAIIGLAGQMLREASSEREIRRLVEIDRAGKHLLSVINDVLDLSKIEAGRFELEEGCFDLSQLLDYVRSMIAASANEKGITIEIDTDAMPLWLRGDVVRLRQALLNYATNAVKFTERGRIELRASLLSRDNDMVVARFEARDTGVGIESDAIPRLFNAFEQADLSTTRRYGGTGLGLAITRRIAELMGGEVGVESEPGVGAAFWFTARLAVSAVAPDVYEGSDLIALENELSRRSSGKILVVEDNAINAEVAVALLGNVGLAADVAVNGEEAVRMAKAQDYALLLMDIQMPLVDGYEATRRLRADPDWPQKPIIAMTANVFDDDRRACRDAGMMELVPKPIDPQRLFQTLLRWLPSPEMRGGFRPAPSDAPPAALFSIAGVDATASLRRLNRDRTLYARLMTRFSREHRDDAAKIQSCLAMRDFDTAGRLAHTLKGAAATLGMLELRDHSAQAESACASGEAPGAALTGMDEELRRLVDAIDAVAPPPQSPPPPEEEEEDVLSAFLTHLVQSDAGVNDIARAHGDELRRSFGDDWTVIAALIEEYRYPEALEKAQRIREAEGRLSA
jgi:two-component system, sensor histidine kinase and response regulator